MAAPLSADRLLATLRAEGVKVSERSGWRTHNRNSKGSWSDLNGIVIHHTAGRDSLALCWSGTDALPGPLCHTHLAKSGVATMVGYGRTNHAGTFAQNAFNAMRDEASVHPRPDAAEPVDANARTYGIEIENLGDGKDPYPDVQYGQAVRWAAAICRAHGWSADSVIGHKEGTRRKIDPSFGMDAFRKAVDERLAHEPSWNPDEEDDVALTDADIDKIAAAAAEKTLKLDGVIKSDTDSPDNPYVSLATITRNAAVVVRRVETKVAALTEANAKLVDAVAQLAAGVGDLDPAAIVTELKAAIENITIHLDADGA
ncbi:N-acetylmuramoyl-L-alanine amidase [Streptomyces sp. MMG1533]|uniref:peptidoglycan recognition protein family protein n=1 Tax=Streptomyces sp. MMG1533 TaxID=1415546 RepID=UPI0007C80AB2|nr:N-acetylmuramoyl-L-alanine amidase [Streptomyces sp. MMG1533]